MSTEDYKESDVVGRECVHASYSVSKWGKKRDIVFVKELVHLKDGRRIPNCRIVEDFKRPFGILKKPLRVHKDKRPYEELKNLDIFKCTQHQLHDSVARALGRPGAKGTLRQLFRDPAVYGADIKTPVLLKRAYRDKWDVEPTPSSVAVYDIETNMNSGNGEIILASMTMKNKIRTRVNIDWVVPERRGTFLQEVRNRAWELIGDVFQKRGITNETLDIDFAASPGGCVAEAFEAAHLWRPDYVVIFNMKFDIPESLKALEADGLDPNAVFSDPSVPREFRNFQWNEGRAEKVKKNDGDEKATPIHPIDQWHTCDTQASFIIADSMLLYKRIRIASANDPEYNLDYLLAKHGLKQKLKFEEADHLEKGAWHEFMQEHFPVEYTVYNIFDCIATESLDEETGDIKYTLPQLLKCSEYHNYDSQPTMVADDYYFFLLKEGKMIGTTSDQMITDVDKFSPGLRGWISTLHAYLGPNPESDVIKDFGGLNALLYTNTSDVDVVST